jgi:hypothetical protein
MRFKSSAIAWLGRGDGVGHRAVVVKFVWTWVSGETTNNSDWPGNSAEKRDTIVCTSVTESDRE